MNVGNVISTVRRTLMDDIVDDYRNTDSALIGMLQNSIRELVAWRPALRLASGGTLRDVETMTLGTGATMSSTMLVDETYLLPLAYGVCEQVYRDEDSDDFNANRASEMRAKFLDLI
jgi:hypothetical protein